MMQTLLRMREFSQTVGRRREKEAEPTVGIARLADTAVREGADAAQFVDVSLKDFTMRPPSGPGHFMFGPRRAVGAGRYHAYAWFRIPEGARIDRLVFDAVAWSADVAAELGGATFTVAAGGQRLVVIVLTFDVAQGGDLELRLWSDGHDGPEALEVICLEASAASFSAGSADMTAGQGGGNALADASLHFVLASDATIFRAAVDGLPEQLEIQVDPMRWRVSGAEPLLPVPVPSAIAPLANFARALVQPAASARPPRPADALRGGGEALAVTTAPTMPPMVVTVQPLDAAEEGATFGGVVSLDDPLAAPTGPVDVSCLAEVPFAGKAGEAFELKPAQRALVRVSCSCDAWLVVGGAGAPKSFRLEAGVERLVVIAADVPDDTVMTDHVKALGADRVEVIATGWHSVQAKSSEVHLTKAWGDFLHSAVAPRNDIIAHGNFVNDRNELKFWSGTAVFPRGRSTAVQLRCHPWGGIALLKSGAVSCLVNLYSPREQMLLFTPDFDPPIVFRDAPACLNENGVHPALEDYFLRKRPDWLKLPEMASAYSRCV